MTDSLFDLGSAAQPPTPPENKPIRDDQMRAIRDQFLAAGIDDQDQRKEIVQSAVIRDVSSLRDLFEHEARRIIERIKATSDAKLSTSGASAWDLRDEDTWIDKL
ncbi:hypothetical protein I6N91_00265 [Arthrobacter sp. MSA 4-2]|uniref:hypothetical protein n=1 Tax=Arthrobacter sp. MSA 4-2 TaxID=2794349 RepID=UPI0018E72F0E|nr:hypothetical protein [Arthrobacter sp. MSA 4-2]MBJ2119408.1 hypothetical protein [Arthrobacter sp. MSA 4-2]